MAQPMKVCSHCNELNPEHNQYCTTCNASLALSKIVDGSQTQQSEQLDSSTRVGCGSLIRWVITSAIGFGSGLLIGEIAFPDDYQYQVVLWLTIGGSIGLIQFFAVSEYVQQWTWLWPFVTIIGIVTGWIVAQATLQSYMTAGGGSDMIPAWLIIGGGMGILQWPLLQRRFRLAWLWIPTNAIGALLGLSSVGILFGISTGVALALIVQFPTQTKQKVDFDPDETQA